MQKADAKGGCSRLARGISRRGATRVDGGCRSPGPLRVAPSLWTNFSARFIPSRCGLDDMVPALWPRTGAPCLVRREPDAGRLVCVPQQPLPEPGQEFTVEEVVGVKGLLP
jgi:hypothetical protein